jgi:hypothetical protein
MGVEAKVRGRPIYRFNHAKVQKREIMGYVDNTEKNN